jgi:hypothetical protein
MRKLLAAMTVSIALITVTAGSAGAYGGGPANWQIGFAGTGVFPGTGFGFGFWGWCAFSGGVSSGNGGDCQVSQYLHTPSGNVACEQSINISSWHVSPVPFPNFVLSGTATTHPSSATSACPVAGGVPPSFTGFAPGIPAIAGHYNLSGVLGSPAGEFQIQVTQITGPF